MDGKGRNAIQECVFRFFPEEIVREILLRLPVKSLLRFKTVCKSWYYIINCTKFIKEHLNLARAARYNQHKNFLGLLIPDEYASYPFVLYTEDSNGIINAKEIDFPYKLFDDYDNEIPPRACNSCDGLICFVISRFDTIIIWNPSLPEEYKIIPSQRGSNSESVGMGYDPTTDDYKIIKVPFPWPDDEDCVSVEIYSLKRSSWRSKRLPKRDLVYYSTSRVIYANNGFHWIATECNEEDEEDLVDCIIYFDLVKETLDYLNMPSKTLVCLVVMNYKDSIAILCENSESEQELWVLKEYCGMKSSWSKLYCFYLLFGYYTFTLNEKMLIFTKKGQLAQYDGKDGRFEHLVVRDDNITWNEECFYSKFTSAYVESLVSPRRLN